MDYTGISEWYTLDMDVSVLFLIENDLNSIKLGNKMKKEIINNEKIDNQKVIKLQKYIPPKIISYTEAEIIDKIGHAHACSPFVPGFT